MRLLQLARPGFLLLILCLTGPALAEPRRPLKRPVPPARHFFYKISGPSATGWLFGSIHVGDLPRGGGEKIYPLPKTVVNAFSSATSLAVELNPEKVATINPVLTRQEVLTSSVLSEEEKLKLGRLLTGGSTSDAALDKDVCLASLMAQQQVLLFLRERLQSGVDKYFLGKAKSAGKSIIELETMAIQLDALVFNRLTPAQAREFCVAQLKAVLHEKDPESATNQELQKLIKVWKKGDDAGVEELFNHSELKDVSQATRAAAWKILGPDRNTGMAQGIIREMKAGRKVFVVVGAAHLAGSGSIPEILRQQGFKLRRLQ